MFRLVPISIIAILLSSCKHQDTNKQLVTNYKDFKGYIDQFDSLRNLELQKLSQQMAFWDQKLSTSPEGFLYLQKKADLLVKQFDLTGAPEFIDHANELLMDANKQLKGKRRLNNLHKLAENFMTLHQFNKAREVIMQAKKERIANGSTDLLLSDVLMELGEYAKAGNVLEKYELAGNEEFDYLVRASRFQDYLGNLDTAILIMESAVELLSDFPENKALHAWGNTMLGEMYGHQGSLDRSYQHFLKSLAYDSKNEVALKKIAWLMYAQDELIDEAYYLMEKIQASKNTPDLQWDMAEMALGIDSSLATRNYQNFYKQAQGSSYPELYQARVAIAECYLYKDFETALTMAKAEVLARPTLQSYDLLAWIYHLKGDQSSALATVQTFLVDKTEEPLIQYHIGSIYKASNRSEADAYLREALASEFELGPSITKKIESLL